MLRILYILKSIFIGFQIFSKTPLIIGLIPDIILKRKYWRLLKEQCGSMGLRHQESDTYDEFGSLSGTVKGYPVGVLIQISGSSTGTYITIEPRSKKNIGALILEIRKPLSRPQRNEIDFTTNNTDFNFIFKTRRGDEQTANTLSSAPELLDQLVLFYAKWMFRILDFTVDLPHRGITCTLNYGHPFVAYVPPDALREILDDLAGVVSCFDERMSA